MKTVTYVSSPMTIENVQQNIPDIVSDIQEFPNIRYSIFINYTEFVHYACAYQLPISFNEDTQSKEIKLIETNERK